jgi:hypothetical protein
MSVLLSLQWPKDNRKKDKQRSTKYYREGQTLQWPKDKRQMTKMLGSKITRVLINFNATVKYCEMVPPT